MTNGTKTWLWAMFGSFVALGLVGLVLFQDNLRALSGSSADALAGEQWVVSPRSSPDRRKSLKTFALEADPPIGIASAPPQPTSMPNRAVDSRVDALSTFAIDVDTASYTYARRQLLAGLPLEPTTVRVEEWVNAFRYALEAPKDAPWALHAEGAPSPFDRKKVLLKVALQGRRFSPLERKSANLVFLVDTSGSMAGEDRLPLAKRALRMLVEGLDDRDTVAIATYAGSAQVVLPATNAAKREVLLEAIDSLGSGGSTAMESGMVLAYREAAKGIRPGVETRVMVFTDGDANIGNTTHEALLGAVSGFVRDGVMLTTVGFGMGNYRDHTLEQLADQGNGQSLYVDSLAEAERLFSRSNLPGLLQTISKDVKVQVAFDASVVTRYRLLGYENRDVRDQDFRNDLVDGGELGAGHAVTALYELELSGARGALGTLTVRGKQPGNGAPFELSRRLEQDVLARSIDDASPDFRFATAVAMAADVFRGNAEASVTLEEARALAETAIGEWPERREFLSLLRLGARPRTEPAAYGSRATFEY